MNYLLAFFAYLVAVTLKAIQQRQVQHAEYRKMPAISYGMAACDVFLVAMIARAEGLRELLVFAFAIGTGGALGSILGTWLHVRQHDALPTGDPAGTRVRRG